MDMVAVYDAPDFNLRMADGNPVNSLDLTMALGEMTMIAAKAASQNGTVLPVDFAFASDSEAVSADGGMIEATAPTTGATITITAVGRGVEIELTVKVLDVIKRIEFASDQATSYVLPVGGSIALMTPVAYNAEEDGEMIAGAEALIDWVSSDPDVVSVDGNTITAESTGMAVIRAMGQGVTSKAKISVTVAGGTGVIRYVMNPYPSSLSDRTRTLTLAVADDPATEDVDETVARSVVGPGAATDQSIVFGIQVLEVGPDGRTSNNDDTVTVTIRSQNPDVVAIPSGSETVTTSTADATITIQTGAEWIVGHGTAYLVVSIPGAEDLPLAPIMIEMP